MRARVAPRVVRCRAEEGEGKVGSPSLAACAVSDTRKGRLLCTSCLQRDVCTWHVVCCSSWPTFSDDVPESFGLVQDAPTPPPPVAPKEEDVPPGKRPAIDPTDRSHRDLCTARLKHRQWVDAGLQKGQGTAVATGVVSLIIGVGYLFLASMLDSRELLPPPPEALGL
jgi:hypothetical protein